MDVRHAIAVLLSTTLLPVAGHALERPESATNVAQNYVLFCGGCHGDAGRGVPHKVPALAGKIGRYLHVDGGRQKPHAGRHDAPRPILEPAH